MKLLLVDDDTVDRIAAKRTLDQSTRNIVVIEADTAETGLAFALQSSFDLILLDYQLPTMTGVEFLNTLRASAGNNTPVVMLSHSSDEHVALECIEAGAQDFITKKEVTVSRLLRAIVHSSKRHKIEIELRESREQLRYLAECDPLTGLANRYLFESALTNALSLAERTQSKHALIMLDLDKFKNINDTLGHGIGDELLKIVAHRIQDEIRRGDMVCRLGGDEFAILVHNFDHLELIDRLTQRLLHSINRSMQIDGNIISISSSLGVANYPDCATTSTELMKCADIALYRSKESGRNQAHFYSRELHKKIEARLELENDMRSALSQDQFILHYQPQVCGITDQITGIEALIRWEHPTRGMIPPDQFIPIAEDLGFIIDIGNWVFDTALAQLKKWQLKFDAIEKGLIISINLSPIQLNQSTLLHSIKHLMEKHRIPYSSVELELTESAVGDNTDLTSELLLGLSELGFKLAMDDFGTGYSSMLMLKSHPFQILKIDKSFIQSVFDDEKGETYLKAINAFSKVLGLQIVAEGVETKEQRDLCKTLEFDRLQGYYFCRPVTAKEIEEKYLSAIPKK